MGQFLAIGIITKRVVHKAKLLKYEINKEQLIDERKAYYTMNSFLFSKKCIPWFTLSTENYMKTFWKS